jgi:hypothetical protein
MPYISHTNRVGKMYSLEYTDISEAFFTPHDVAV